ncbi:MAG: nucleoid-associated protein EbfC [Actinomycetota bacterium]|jgi:DNA-binding YbaB/EbfC family protein
MSDEGIPDFSALLEQAQAMQEQLVEAQESVASQEVEGVAGGGVVRIVATGAYEFRSVHIDPSALEDGDPSMVEDLVLAALHDVIERITELNSSALGGLSGLTGLLG